MEEWIYTGGPEGAQVLLSTIAGSLITVAGVAFSVTIVVLSLTSTQFGPRLLRNFMRDLGNQVVLGVFIATFLYCIFPQPCSIDLFYSSCFRLNSGDQCDHGGGARPRSSHRSTLSGRAGGVGIRAEDGREADRRSSKFKSESAPIFSETTGYLQAIENDTLLTLASERNFLIRLSGRFALDDSVLIPTVLPGATPR